MLGLLCFGSANVQAQNFVVDGEPTVIAITKQTGKHYRWATTMQTTNDQVGATWKSNAVSGLSFVYANASKNRFVVTDTNVNPDWNVLETETYDFLLTGDDAIRYSFLGYTASSTSGQVNTVGAPTQINHTFSVTNPTVSVDYTSAGTKVNKMSFRNGRANPGDRWTNGTINIRLQKYKTKKVVFEVQENGQSIYESDSVLVRLGDAEIPKSLTRPLTTLTLVTTTVGETTERVVVNAVFANPFDKASQDAGKKYVVKLANGYYLNHQEGASYTLRQVADFPESYQWKFEGNPYTGVRVQSVQTSGYLAPSGNYAIAQTGVTTEQSTWEVNLNTVTISPGYNVPANGFTLKHATKVPLNVHGGTKILSFWGTVDGNSVFMVDTVPSDFKPLVLSSYQAVAEAGAGIFKLTEAKYNEFLPLYTAAVNKTTAVTYEEYRAIKTIVETEANYQLPETGYYRVKNANVADRYMNLEGTMLRASKNRADVQRDASSVIYVKKQEDGTYLLNTTGRTLAVVSADNGGDKTVFADNNAIQSVTMSLAGLGKGYLQIGTNVNGYLFYWAEQANRVHTYSKNYSNTGQWSFEPAKTVTVPLNSHEGKSYATACFPFPVSISTENVKAYNVVPQGATGRSNMEELATEIPVGTPMLLVSETAADSVTFTIGESAPTSTEPTTAAFKGNFLGQTVTANTLLTLGRSSSTPQKVGFYKYTGTTLAPFRAYFTVAELTALLAGANGFSINFDDLTTGVSGVEVQTESTGSVYDLAGRKVTKATKGLYIINGKKVIR